MKRLQFIINILTFILIIICLIICYYLITNSKYSKKYIKELVDKNTNTSNYIMEICFTGYGQENFEKITQKENYRKVEYCNSISNKILIYANDFEINDTNKTYTQIKIEDSNSNEDERIHTTKELIELHVLHNEFGSYPCINGNSEYKYLGKEKYNNTTCIKCKLYTYSTYEGNHYVIVWIDIETGLILKEENYVDDQLESTFTYKTKVNSVTDKDTIIPDLKNYTFID